jgi:hypothetical protein
MDRAFLLAVSCASLLAACAPSAFRVEAVAGGGHHAVLRVTDQLSLRFERAGDGSFALALRDRWYSPGGVKWIRRCAPANAVARVALADATTPAFETHTSAESCAAYVPDSRDAAFDIVLPLTSEQVAVLRDRPLRSVELQATCDGERCPFEISLDASQAARFRNGVNQLAPTRGMPE